MRTPVLARPRAQQTATEVAIADRWSGSLCFLNNVPAKVLGWLDNKATIQTNDRSENVSFDWRHVNMVMSSHKNFTSKRF